MGEWDLCLERANALVRVVEEGSPRYGAANAYGRRGMIRLARGNDDVALADTARALELARPVEESQLLFMVLLDAVRAHVETGDEAAASALFDETLTRLGRLPSFGFSVFYAHTLAWFGRFFGREADVEKLFSRRTSESRWLDSGRAILAGDLRTAIDILADIDAPVFEAFFRLKHGTEPDVRAALEFYRGVRATRYVHEGEALLAATA
jgi:hypothetical protein